MGIEKMFKVSVVSTALKDEDFDRLKKDLNNQTYRDFETILITTNKTRPHGWNRGIELARGQYILFTESDVGLPPNWIEEMVKHLEKEDFVIGEEVVKTTSPLCMSNVGIKSEIAKKIKFDESMVIGDTDWFIRLGLNGVDIKEGQKKDYPIVFHYKSREPLTLLKRAWDSGIMRATLIRRYWRVRKDSPIPLGRMLISPFFYLVFYSIRLLGYLYGFTIVPLMELFKVKVRDKSGWSP